MAGRGEARSDEGRLQAFVLAHGAALLRLAYLLCGDRGHAEDLVQDTLVAVHRHWPRVEAADHPLAYVRTMLTNAYLSSRRQRWRRERPAALVDDAPTGPPEHDVAERDAMWRLLATLPARQRAVLVLRYYEGLDDGEIARVFGCARGTVRSLASRSFAALRPRLERERETSAHGED